MFIKIWQCHPFKIQTLPRSLSYSPQLQITCTIVFTLSFALVQALHLGKATRILELGQKIISSHLQGQLRPSLVEVAGPGTQLLQRSDSIPVLPETENWTHKIQPSFKGSPSPIIPTDISSSLLLQLLWHVTSFFIPFPY